MGRTSTGETTTSRRRRALVTSIGVAIASVVMVSGSAVHADQTVRFDDAGSAPHISLIGDSTLAGVRWYDGYGPLEQYNFVFSAESCRRTFERSCISREGYRSANVVTAMDELDGELGELLVVMSGYNDPIATIDEAIAAVVDEARSQGVGHVVWLTLRVADDVDYSDPQDQSSVNTFREYNEQLVAAASASGGYLQVADWATYSDGRPSWFEHDGVHLTRSGADAVATFIADTVQRVTAGENVSPAAAPWSALTPGVEGDAVTAVQGALVAAGIDLAGGVDGVYGDATMVAVAEYQRRNAVPETGVVDVATARALGVYPDPNAAPAAAATTAAPTAAAPTAATSPAPERATGADEPAVAVTARQDVQPSWPVLAAATTAGLAVAVVARRRYVVARRASRRWARVHPATSPRRSVADMRRAGTLPPHPGTGRRLHDHQAELTALVDADAPGPESSGEEPR